ncbi:MAG: hypothetical protein EPO26_15190 [Chloroflexota bacterium]|nr:MAG: hypothetical protein EPO26_15190 [Chloroflexota bacterium]
MATSRRHADIIRRRDGVRVAGGPVALAMRAGADGARRARGTCILQRFANGPTAIDPDERLSLRLDDGREMPIRLLRVTMTACGPEIAHFVAE